MHWTGPEHKMESGVEVDAIAPSPGSLPGPRNFQGLDFFLLPRHKSQSQLQSQSPDEACPPMRLRWGDSGSFCSRRGSQLALVSVIVSPVHLN